MTSDKDDYDLIQHDIKEKERQPMSQVKEYKQLVKKSGKAK